MPPEVQVVQIPLEDWVGLRSSIERMETKLDAAFGDIDDHESRMREVEKVKDPVATFKNHDERISSLEKWRSHSGGYAAALATLGGGVTGLASVIAILMTRK